jgi:hypothetical protein
MSKPKRALAAAIEHAVTKGQPQDRKLPDTIPLTRSQALSLTALNNDEQRLRKQAQDLNAALEATIKARTEVLEEISKASTVSVSDMAGKYSFDGAKLFIPV